jgi:hypothetical protein
MSKTKTKISIEVYEDGSSSFVGETPIPAELAAKLEDLLYRKPRKHKALLKKWVEILEKIVQTESES